MEVLFVIGGVIVVLALVKFTLDAVERRLSAAIERQPPAAESPLPERPLAEPHALDAPAPPRPVPVIGVTSWGGVFLEYAELQTVLVVLPLRELEALDALAEAPNAGAIVEAVIVCNHDNGDDAGYLWASEICRRIGFERGPVYATAAERPIDRLPDASRSTSSPRHAQALGVVRLGVLTLEHTCAGLSAVWGGPYGDYAALIGAQLPFSFWRATPLPRQLIGSLAFADPDEPGSAMPPMDIAMDVLSCQMTLLEALPPGSTELMRELWPLVGIHVTVVESSSRSDSPLPAWVAGALAIVAAARAAEPERLAAQLERASTQEIEQVLRLHCSLGDLEQAERVAAAALAHHPDDGALWFHRGVAAFMDARLTDAEAHYRRALAVASPYVYAHNNLALTLRKRGELDAALEQIAAAQRALPDDPIVAAAAEALALEAAGEVVVQRDTFPLHAELVAEFARAQLAAGEPEQARALARRAAELHPSDPTIQALLIELELSDSPRA